MAPSQIEFAPRVGPGRHRIAAAVALTVAGVGLLLSAGAGYQTGGALSGTVHPALTTNRPLFADAVVNLAAGDSYPVFDNDVFADCVAATAGDLIITSFGTTPATSDITDAFFSAGGTSTEGLTWAQLVGYWSSAGIDSTRLTAWSPLVGPNVEARIEGWLQHGGTIGKYQGQRAVIDRVDLPTDALVAGTTFNFNPGNHMWLVVGYSPADALVVSWGSEFEVSWATLLRWSSSANGGGGFDVVAVAK
jgi:hypothetical protein